jgi:broad specificity phosphatase PhoE
MILSDLNTRSLATALLALVMILAPAAHAELDDASLVDALREGGFNIYFRHAQTNWSQADRITGIEDTGSCDGERVRQLSDEGRRTSSGVGDAIRALRIPVARVLASPYCRTMDTARLMAVGEVEESNDVMNLRAAQFVGGRDAVIERAKALLATAPDNGTNIIIVAHGNVAQTATPVYPGEAEGVVFRPDGAGGFELVGRITPERWMALAEAFGE